MSVGKFFIKNNASLKINRKIESLEIIDNLRFKGIGFKRDILVKGLIDF